MLPAVVFLPVALAGALLAGVVPAAHVESSCPAPDAPPRVVPVSDVTVARLTLARCVQADLDGGRWRDAAERLDRARQAAALLREADRLPWQVLVVRLEATRHVDAGQWTALVDVVIPQEDVVPWVGPLVRGVAAARSSWALQDASLQRRARAELVQLERLARTAGTQSEAERARLMVQGAIAGAQYERDEMQLLLEAAHDLETRLQTGDELRPPVVLAVELEADLLRITDRYAAASQRYRDLLTQWPRRVQSRIGLAGAYRRLGFIREADETLAQARDLWASADAEAKAQIK
jgi:hypothetical protein